MIQSISGMTVAEAFKVRQSEALEVIEQLKARVSKLDGDFDDVNWSQVGSMHKATFDLIDIVNLLG